VRSSIFLAACGLLALGAAPSVREDIEAVRRQGRGTAEGRAAWQRLSEGGPEVVPALLEAMSSKDTVSANWLRTAFERVIERELQAGGRRLDSDGLLHYTQDATKPGRARRLALEVVERLRPGTSEKLYRDWLDDVEFHYEAVALLLRQAREQLQQKAPDAAASFRRAFDKARDVQQCRDAAAGLQALGVQVSVAEHLGFLTDWFLIGPFDGMGMKGFHAEYSPEKRVALEEELTGQGRKVRWQRYQVREPSPTAKGGHQALVNLREKSALGDADDAVAFAYTEFEIAQAGEAEFRGAADDNFTVWVNGQKVFAFEEYRNGVRLDRHRFKVPLRAGKNTVLVKICQTPAPNPEPNWEFFLRVVDETGRGIAMRRCLP
jgi:hypothetical protein